MSGEKIDVEGLKQVQLDILDAVHRFCTENGIDYSLSSGTLIGAVRHKGFIPWDDDIDICMLRSDYVKLEKAFPKLLDGKYEFKSLSRDPEWNRPWGKVEDNRTLLKESFNDSMASHGIGIDVFPMDDVPEDKAIFNPWNRKRKMLVYAWSIKGMKYSSHRSFVNNLTMALVKVLLLPFSLRQIALVIDRYIQKPNNKGYNKMYESCDSLKAGNYQSRSDFDSYVELEFEGKPYKAMAGYDDYLRNIYGDYMQLPPVEKRVSHHSFKAYWK